MANIVDGTSNTIAGTESCVTTTTDASKPSDRVKGGVGQAAIYGGGSNVLPGLCLNQRTQQTLLLNPMRSFRGSRWADGRMQFAGINLVLPPNSPTCIRTGMAWTYWGVFSANSNHSGGVNAVLFDGSVRFISDTIYCGNTGGTFYPRTYFTQESPFGIWGALGTINGGENTTM